MKEKEIQKNGRSPFKLRKIKVEKPIRKKKETEIYESNFMNTMNKKLSLIV